MSGDFVIIRIRQAMKNWTGVEIATVRIGPVGDVSGAERGWSGWKGRTGC